ncbi:MAG TPA: hypothetical protein VF590_17650, partial [Isosphaeraceae bacterium]
MSAPRPVRHPYPTRLVPTLGILAALVACAARAGQGQVASDGPPVAANPNPHRVGDPAAGRDVFRFETF